MRADQEIARLSRRCSAPSAHQGFPADASRIPPLASRISLPATRYPLPATRPGLSLLEMMLVLALLVVVGALAVPALHGPLDNQRLRNSADQVRTQWAKARTGAMRSGQTLMFRYEPGGSQYQVQPWYADEDYLEMDLASMQSDPRQLASQLAAGGGPSPPDSRTLPEGVVFWGGQTRADSRSLGIQQSLLQGRALGAGGWSEPVLFYPDGTTSTAQVVVANERRKAVAVQLRGLTGIAQVGDLTGLEDVAP